MTSSERRGNDRAFPACVTNLHDLTQARSSLCTPPPPQRASPWSCGSMLSRSTNGLRSIVRGHPLSNTPAPRRCGRL